MNANTVRLLPDKARHPPGNANQVTAITKLDSRGNSYGPWIAALRSQ
jgi:hypothetical protein